MGFRHMTVSNSWPLDLSASPELAAAGAYTQTEKFSEADIKEVIKYAGEVSIIEPLDW